MVDVNVRKANGEPKAYTIMRVRDSLPDDSPAPSALEPTNALSSNSWMSPAWAAMEYTLTDQFIRPGNVTVIPSLPAPDKKKDHGED